MVLVKKCPYLLDASLRKCLVSSYIVLWFGVKTSKCYVCYTNKSTAHESVKSLVYTMLAPWFYLSSTVLFSPFFSSLLHRRQFAAHMCHGKISLVQTQFSCYSLSECHKCDWKWRKCGVMTHLLVTDSRWVHVEIIKQGWWKLSVTAQAKD